MGLKVGSKAKAKVPAVEPGVYPVICCGVIDMGEQYSERFKKWTAEVRLTFELVGESVTIEGEELPRQLGRSFTFSASPKGNLRKFISSWLGTQFTDEGFAELDLFSLLGQKGQISVTLNDTGEYANIDTIMPLPKGFPVPAMRSKPIQWSMDEWDDGAFSELPDWVREKIKKSNEYQRDHASQAVVDFGEVDPATGEYVDERKLPF